jgi:hypothetical protein
MGLLGVGYAMPPLDEIFALSAHGSRHRASQKLEIIYWTGMDFASMAYIFFK